MRKVRFGQSFTLMPDGRTILVGGEHEDSYDPDFCIYNDVTVFFPGGDIKVFGYPYHVFEPTDFHTATLVGDFILILGGLNYADQRQGTIPVYRLDTTTYAIERITTTGEIPPRVHGHRAELVGGEIVLYGGTATTFKGEEQCSDANSDTYRLNIETYAWTQARD